MTTATLSSKKPVVRFNRPMPTDPKSIALHLMLLDNSEPISHEYVAKIVEWIGGIADEDLTRWLSEFKETYMAVYEIEKLTMLNMRGWPKFAAGEFKSLFELSLCNFNAPMCDEMTPEAKELHKARIREFEMRYALGREGAIDDVA